MEPTPAVAPVLPKKIGKFRASYLLAAESFELFRKDQEILWFVVWNAISVLAVTVLFALGFGVIVAMGAFELPAEGEPIPMSLHVIGYAVFFIFYLVCSYITAYFGVALTSVVAARIEGENKGFLDGIRTANERAGKILGWSLLASTVGLILQIIADKANWVGKLFSWVGGVAWGVATFFIVPVLAREDQTVGGSVKRSGEIFVATWGETIIMNFSLGLFFGAIHFGLIFMLLVGGFFILQSMTSLFLFTIYVVAFLLLFIAVMIMHAVLDAVFKVVLYEYATRGTVPDSFTPELIIGALTKKAVPASVQ